MRLNLGAKHMVDILLQSYQKRTKGKLIRYSLLGHKYLLILFCQVLAEKWHVAFVWIGGRSEEEDNWYWSDDSEWGNFQKWSPEALRNSEETSDKCLQMKDSFSYIDSFDWEVESCTETLAFICKFPKTPIGNAYKIPLSETGDSIHFWMRYKDMAAEELYKKGKLPGFTFTWKVESEINNN